MFESKKGGPGSGRYLKKKPDTGLALAAPFLVTLAALTVVSFILPLRPTRSQMEKRDLAPFPEFSWEALGSGTYFDDISTWFSDTFPGREQWLELATEITALHGNAEVVIAGDLPMVEEIPPMEPEQDVLIQADPQPTEDTGSAGNFPSEAATTPTEEAWNGVDAGENAIIEISDTAIIQIGDSAFNALGFNDTYSQRYATSIGAFADAMKEQGIRVISAPAPTAVGVLIEPEYLEKLRCANQEEMIDYLHSLMGGNVIKVDSHGILSEHRDEYIYFRSDHHWTARGAYYVYYGICQSLGLEAAPLEDFREWDMGDFEGSLWTKVTRPKKLRLDRLYAYVAEDDVTMTIYSDNYGYGNGVEWDMIQDVSQRRRNEKYSAFLRNDNPLTKLVNNDLPEGSSCILVKDSFGNCLAPYLTQNYHTVYVIDYRKFYTPLTQFLKTHPVDDIIFSPYLIATQAMDGSRLFQKLCQ